MSACKENVYFCEKREDNAYYLYTLRGNNDKLYELSFNYVYDLDMDIKEEYISKFISFYEKKDKGFEFSDNSLKIKKDYLIDKEYSIIKTVEQFQKDYYFCHKGK